MRPGDEVPVARHDVGVDLRVAGSRGVLRVDLEGPRGRVLLSCTTPSAHRRLDYDQKPPPELFSLGLRAPTH